MSFAGFKKQINKANQYVSERIGGAKGTELDDEFVEMEKQVDTIGKVVDEMISKTEELLQPNPASRAKMAAMKGVSKLRGQHNQTLYPQPEGQLGECMTKHGRDLAEDSVFGQALTEAGESYRQLADVKYSLEDVVRQNFLEPLQHLQSKDLKEVNFLRKKLSGRRLDYDCKKRKQQKDGTSITEEEIQQAEDKFEESKQLAEVAMQNLLDNEVEHLTQLIAFIEAEVNYHQQSLDVLQTLLDSLRQKCSKAAGQPRRDHIPKRAVSTRSTGSAHSKNGSYDTSESNYRTAPAPMPSAASRRGSSRSKPCAEAVYDFEAENANELSFNEGDMIDLVARVDENWFEGEVHGRSGLFPVTYVRVVVDLP